MPTFGPNQCFLGVSGKLVPLLPYFEGAELNKNVFHAIEAIAHVFQGRHHQKKTFFAGKWPKNANF